MWNQIEDEEEEEISDQRSVGQVSQASSQGTRYGSTSQVHGKYNKDIQARKTQAIGGQTNNFKLTGMMVVAVLVTIIFMNIMSGNSWLFRPDHIIASLSL